MAERASLESLCTARYRGFESRPLRKLKFYKISLRLMGVKIKVCLKKQIFLLKLFHPEIGSQTNICLNQTMNIAL